eukprot:CAMPEP_0170551730 /NCGR_PEP_ID=MMETSP0211-20121228/9732_1 /TAXON_ID=311385 /ORGANISM="Pseudokeronopsis sp., Strain OXSARD2" /LENGTH=34 /DNA_ID= /DNA_START= /DNA_END= /DNA_ORIENTATION=
MAPPNQPSNVFGGQNVQFSNQAPTDQEGDPFGEA